LNPSNGWSRADLRIYDETLRLEDVEVALGLKATGTHLRGQLRSKGHKATWPDSMWRFGSSLEEDRGLEGNLVWLLDSLDPRRNIIRTFSEKYRVDFFCGFSSGDERGGFTLASVTLNRIANFGVPLIMNLSPPQPPKFDESGIEVFDESDRKWSRGSLRLFGETPQPEEIEATLGLKATCLYSNGQRKSSEGEAVWRESLWSLQSPLGDDANIADHVEWLLDSIERKRDVVRALSRKYRIDLFCGFSSANGQGGFTLNSVTIARIAKLGAPLVVKLYLPGISDDQGE
jgi:hypothetical protein